MTRTAAAVAIGSALTVAGWSALGAPPASDAARRFLGAAGARSVADAARIEAARLWCRAHVLDVPPEGSQPDAGGACRLVAPVAEVDPFTAGELRAILGNPDTYDVTQGPFTFQGVFTPDVALRFHPAEGRGGGRPFEVDVWLTSGGFAVSRPQPRRGPLYQAGDGGYERLLAALTRVFPSDRELAHAAWGATLEREARQRFLAALPEQVQARLASMPSTRGRQQTEWLDAFEKWLGSAWPPREHLPELLHALGARRTLFTSAHAPEQQALEYEGEQRDILRALPAVARDPQALVGAAAWFLFRGSGLSLSEPERSRWAARLAEAAFTRVVDEDVPPLLSVLESYPGAEVDALLRRVVHGGVVVPRESPASEATPSVPALALLILARKRAPGALDEVRHWSPETAIDRSARDLALAIEGQPVEVSQEALVGKSDVLASAALVAITRFPTRSRMELLVGPGLDPRFARWMDALEAFGEIAGPHWDGDRPPSPDAARIAAARAWWRDHADRFR